MTQKIRYVIGWLLSVTILYQLFTGPQVAYAEEISGRKNALDVTFVVDVSGSMKTNDPNQIALDMVKAFIDTVHVQNIRVGFVAYNDEIVSSASPISMVEASERERLKSLIDATAYSGNTDIGLGLSMAYRLMPKESGRNRVIVLISDGESDLGGSTTGRTLEQSNQELTDTVNSCREEAIPIYTIAFGTYGGSKETLENIAADSGANVYSAENPELLIEVLYDIFNLNLSYKIQKLTTGMYASGSQEIRCVLDEVYLNEIDILLISPKQIGDSSIRYGDKEVALTKMSYYAVGKITGSDIDRTVKELIVNTTTADGQQLDIYIVNYRSLEPILNVETDITRNSEVPYEVYFKDETGEIVRDESFYKTFTWELQLPEEADSSSIDEKPAQIEEGVLKGSLSFADSGTYAISGQLTDNLGSYQFRTEITVKNTTPAGALPAASLTRMGKGGVWNLNEYFSDADGDALEYSLEIVQGEVAEAVIDGNMLSVSPVKSGNQTIEIRVSDGEASAVYSFQVEVIPLWKTYWWVLALLILVAAVILWKLLHKPKPELVQIMEEKARNRFNGKLNAYFTKQPDENYEIPPLVFHLYKIKDNRLCLGDLMKDYPEAADQLGLDQIHLIADEERKMILYHTADSTIMIGNSIACRRIQYSISFGDVIYITSPNDEWDLELHYIAMIQ